MEENIKRTHYSDLGEQKIQSNGPIKLTTVRKIRTELTSNEDQTYCVNVCILFFVK